MIQGKGLEVITPAVLALLPSQLDANDFNLSGEFSVQIWMWRAHRTHLIESNSGKLQAFGALLENLHALKEEKIIVVSNFTSTLDIVEAHCKVKQYPYCRLDGWADESFSRKLGALTWRLIFARRETKGADRIPMVNAFNSGPVTKNCELRSIASVAVLIESEISVIFLVSSKSGGTGLNRSFSFGFSLQVRHED